MTRPSRRPASLVLALALAVTALGCGGGCGGGGGPPMGSVEGAVSVDGSPAAAGTVTFTPTDGVRAAASVEIKGGKYALSAPVGPCKVQVSVLKKVGEKKAYGNDPNSPVVPIYEEGVAAEFNDKSTLTYDVAAGKATKDWETKSRVKK